ncbi:GEN endonuclease, partial [Turnix velox]|nr:GEN endonuclease [Turnix velox]
MGVTNLWQILEPVKQPVNLSSLKGKTLAVDLSLWVCEAQAVKKMIGVVTKPHLRNLFFRFSFFISMGIKLVFVMEGEAPRLKADTMSKRNRMRYGPTKNVGAARTGRSSFKTILKECLELLECLGVPWVQAAGEAEAMCAYLNVKGLVDGCITNDGDVFLYGAQTVYRNFAMNAKDPLLDCYTMSSIKEKLGCDRESLIGLAILLGCDYLPKGVPGVGKEQALKLIETLHGQNLLQRFEQWKSPCDNNLALVVKRVAHCSECHHPGSYKEHEHNGCKFCESTRSCKPSDSECCCPCEWHQLEQMKQASAVENNIRKKANSCEGFPFSEVIQEFLVNKNKLIKIKECQRPNLLSFQIFASEKMEWDKHYACKKLLTLLTHYDMIQRKSGYTDSKQLQAVRILKRRVRNGIPCFEIEWQKPEHYVDPEDEPAELFVVTVEEETLFQAAYPDVVAHYQVEKAGVLKKKQKSKSGNRKEKELPNVCDEVSDRLSQMSLKSECEILSVQDSISDEKYPAVDQKQWRSTELKDLVLGATSCITGVEMAASTALPLSASPSSLSQNAQDDENASSSSVIAGLQLSSIDWEGTSFSTSSARGGDNCDPAANLTTYIKHSHHGAVRSSSEYSDAPQSDQHHSDSASDLVFVEAVGQTEKWSLSERIHKKSSIPRKPLLSEDVMQLQASKCFKQTKETLNCNKDNISSSCQLNKLMQGSKNVLWEDCSRESSLPVYKQQYKKADSLAEVLQKDHNINSSTPLTLSGQTMETLHPGCEMLPVSQKTADGCCTKKAYAPTTWKTSFMKSVCQNRCSSSEDSDDENVNKKQIYKQQNSKANPAQFKKRFTKERSAAVTSKRVNSDSALTIKEEKRSNFKKAGNSLSLQVSPNPSSVGEINCFQIPEQLLERSASGPMQKSESAVPTFEWADSPLPLSERLKRRIKLN